MGTVTVGRENSTPIDIYYEDHGAGQPVVLIHGFPLNRHSWEKQIGALLETGHRVIAYDRRGFGDSSQPACGYDYDTLASDFNILMTTLDLHEAVLIGHSMGTGEVVRYLGVYGSKRVTRAALIAPLGPFLLKTAENPDGLDEIVFERAVEALARDRLAYLMQFLADAFNLDAELGRRVSNEVLQYTWNIAIRASATGTAGCAAAFLTDFRTDLVRIDVPVLIVAGGKDRILPFAATGARLRAALSRSRLILIEDAPHALLWTHADDVNRAIGEFIDS